MKAFQMLAAGMIAGCLTPGLLADTLEERVARLEAQSNAAGGLPSWLSFKGELELEYKDIEQDPSLAASNSHARWDIDKFVFGIGVKFSDNLKMVAEFEGNEGTFFLEEGYAQFGLGDNTWSKVGLVERFSKAEGKFGMGKYYTETYPMAGSANWRDDAYQIQFGGKTGNFFWRASVGDGLELTDRSIGEDNGAGTRSEIIHDNDMGSDTAQEGHKLEYGVGAGMEFEVSDAYKFDISAWHFESELNTDEKTFLFGTTGFMSSKHLAAAATDGNANFALAQEAILDRQQRSGVRSTHVLNKDTRVMYEGWESVDGRLRRNGWYVDVAHKIKFSDPLIGGEFVKSITPNLRYEEYDVNMPAAYADPQTWDRVMTVYAVQVELTSNNNLKSTLKLEWLENLENTGHGAGPIVGGAHTNAARIKNDEFLAQLELKF